MMILATGDENGFSLSGSQIQLSREYVAFLEDFMLRNQIHSVVDVGCGDWAFSRISTGAEFIYGYRYCEIRHRKELGE